MDNNRYYDFKEAVKASESIIGNGILIDSAGTEWDCFNLLDNIDDSDSREAGGNAYWCIGWDGSIGYTEDNGYNVRWDFKPIQD